MSSFTVLFPPSLLSNFATNFDDADPDFTISTSPYAEHQSAACAPSHIFYFHNSILLIALEK